ncbi:unnamed protein product [Fusarium venenatum]|uniref:Major facilitator superfamily (MFS) profile domain-containing protein n=1 Tax=Fusarium venenatum TaxID=56646 RepID=A0A2L2TCC6_9HYPO|nr:uncharacterized protein FVRRES_06443 [Fusarium venenatum]KAH6993438.1 major facilitator superfamily domain-containing protein [Fusarium venenatum]CEI62007.1 unnamed protein product [Fusarium venenatum]
MSQSLARRLSRSGLMSFGDVDLTQVSQAFHDCNARLAGSSGDVGVGMNLSLGISDRFHDAFVELMRLLAHAQDVLHPPTRDGIVEPKPEIIGAQPRLMTLLHHFDMMNKSWKSQCVELLESNDSGISNFSRLLLHADYEYLRLYEFSIALGAYSNLSGGQPDIATISGRHSIDALENDWEFPPMVAQNSHTNISSWGVVATCTGVVTNLAGLCACRAVLGILEAAFGAGAPYYLSLLYQRREPGLRVSILAGMSPLANCFAASLAYGISQINSYVEPWRLILLIEGAPAIIIAPFPDFSAKKREAAVTRLGTKDTTSKEKLNWKQATAGLRDYQTYAYAIIHFCCNYSFASLANFLPTIVQSLGYSSIKVQGLTAPPYLASFILCVTIAFFSDQFGYRGFVIAGYSAMAGIGYLLLAIIEDMGKAQIRYLSIWLAVMGVFPCLTLNITWLLNNQGGETKHGIGLAVLAILGQCSSFLSSTVYPKSDAPFFLKGCAIGCALTFAITIMSLGLHFKLAHENRKRDRETGPVEYHEQLDLTMLGDKYPKFRYVT